MKRALFLLLAVAVTLAATGCAHNQMCCPPKGQCMTGSCSVAPETCGSCTDTCGSCTKACGPCGGCGLLGGGGLLNRGCGTCKTCPVGYGGGGGLLGMGHHGMGCGRCTGCSMGTGCAMRKAQRAALMGPMAYPYYTLRGPRDFLVDNPPSIGP